jgi:hypothetical protein
MGYVADAGQGTILAKTGFPTQKLAEEDERAIRR